MNHEKQTYTAGTASDAWREALTKRGYEPQPVTRGSCLQFALLSRTWRRIIRHTGLKRFTPVRVLEFGCGGGSQLVPLYINGWDCTGVDVSPEVLTRAEIYAESADNNCQAKGTIEFKCKDFLNFEPSSPLFDLTFHFGVLEHFLDDDERMRYLRKMFEVTRPGGLIVSYVPNGGHPFRTEQRERGLRGYNIPEIDYSPELIQAEMVSCGASSVKVLPHNLFGYLLQKDERGIRKLFYRYFYYFMQLPVFQLLPASFLNRHAYWFIAIARKPEC